MVCRLAVLITALLLCFGNTAFAERLTVVVEESFPLHYQSDGRIIGSAIDLLAALTEQAGIDYEVQLYPWARAYDTALKQPNVLIMSMARTSEREELFHWIGVVVPIRYALFQRKDKPVRSSESLLSLQPYRIAVVRDDIVHRYLFSQGLRQLVLVDSPQQSFRMLRQGRVDLAPYSMQAVQAMCVDINTDCGAFEAGFKLEELETGLYMAMSISSDPGLVKAVRTAYSQLAESGDRERILSSYKAKPREAVTHK